MTLYSAVLPDIEQDETEAVTLAEFMRVDPQNRLPWTRDISGYPAEYDFEGYRD